MHICVTGAGGFIGSALVHVLEAGGYNVTALTRKENGQLSSLVRWVKWDMEQPSSVECNMANVNVVIHLAGLAHIVREQYSNPLSEFRRINVISTERIARAAAAAGAKRFIFVSTIGVHGVPNKQQIITESSPIRPLDPYSQSKYEAEECLREIAMETGLELVILRPALVVGPGAPGNLDRLARLITHGIPLPISSIDNERSFVGLDDLLSFLQISLEHPGAVGQTFIAADVEWPSTRQVISWISEGMGQRIRTIRMPDTLLKPIFRITGKSSIYDKLFSDHRADSAKARTVIGWKPEGSISDAFRSLGKCYSSRKL